MQQLFDAAYASGLDGRQYIALLEELRHEIEIHIELTRYALGMDEDDY